MLVNNVYSSFDFAQYLGKPFWELPLDAWDDVIDIGARSHYVAACFGVPLLFAPGGGLDRERLIVGRGAVHAHGSRTGSARRRSTR